jgi:hypothetical protein
LGDDGCSHFAENSSTAEATSCFWMAISFDHLHFEKVKYRFRTNGSFSRVAALSDHKRHSHHIEHTTLMFICECCVLIEFEHLADAIDQSRSSDFRLKSCLESVFSLAADGKAARALLNDRLYDQLAVTCELSRSTMVAPLDEKDTRVWDTISTGRLDA